MNKWYVAKTKPGKESLLKTFLGETLDTEVFLPYIRRPEGSNRSLELLFPTYLFCFSDPRSSSWPSIRYAPGLSYFISAGNDITPVPAEIIDNLKERVSNWNDGVFSPGFSSGQRLVVANGPFSGLEAIFQRYVPSRRRCQVLIEVMGHLTKAEIPPEALVNKSPYLGLAAST